GAASRTKRGLRARAPAPRGRAARAGRGRGTRRARAAPTRGRVGRPSRVRPLGLAGGEARVEPGRERAAQLGGAGADEDRLADEVARDALAPLELGAAAREVEQRAPLGLGEAHEPLRAV